jgi:hypothetical protein
MGSTLMRLSCVADRVFGIGPGSCGRAALRTVPAGSAFDCFGGVIGTGWACVSMSTP